MELRHIRYFVAVAEELNFTRAAQRLSIAQPPLSRQIRDLEEELEAQLFERSNHGLTLTPEGDAFLVHARELLSLVERSKEDISELQNGLRGTISIASVEGSVPQQLAAWIGRFKERFPLVQYTIQDGSTDDVTALISSGQCDLGLITEPHNEEGLAAISLYSEPWTAMIPADDPLAQDGSDVLPLSALLDRDLIIPSRSSRLDEIRRWFPEPYPELRVRCRVSHFLNAYELVRKGVGIAIFPDIRKLDMDCSDIVVKRLVEPSVSLDYILVWERSRKLSRSAQAFLDFICTEMGMDSAET